MGPKFSVIIPTFNRARIISFTLDSIFAQHYPHYEVIAVDDGSADETRNVIKLYGDRVRYAYQKNQGTSAAMNAGARLAQGDFLCFLGSDDLLFPDTLSRHARYIEAHPEAAVTYGRFEPFNENGEPFPKSHYEWMRKHWICPPGVNHMYLDWLLESFCPIQTAAIRKSAFVEAGGFDPEISGVEEYDLFLRIAARNKIGFLDGAPLARYRYHAGRTPEQLNRVIIAVLNKHLKLIESHAFPVNERSAKRNIYLGISRMHFHSGDLSNGRKFFIKSVLTHPSALFFGFYLRMFLSSLLPESFRAAMRTYRKRFFPTEFEMLCESGSSSK